MTHSIVFLLLIILFASLIKFLLNSLPFGNFKNEVVILGFVASSSIY